MNIQLYEVATYTTYHHLVDNDIELDKQMIVKSLNTQTSHSLAMASSIGLSDEAGTTKIVIWTAIIFGVFFFPLVPAFFYILLVICPKDTEAEVEKYKRNELRAHEVKSVSGGLEAPVQIILIVYLILRGHLPLPWAQTASSSCLEDSLGRSVCLPSIPVASVVFSLLSLVKALYDLNIYPLVHHYPPSWQRLNTTLDLCLTFLPCFLASAIFRLTTFRKISEKIIYLTTILNTTTFTMFSFLRVII